MTRPTREQDAGQMFGQGTTELDEAPVTRQRAP